MEGDKVNRRWECDGGEVGYRREGVVAGEETNLCKINAGSVILSCFLAKSAQELTECSLPCSMPATRT